MKAVFRNKYGDPSVLEVKELPVPVPGPTDVLIKVMATTVNRTDCGVLWGKPFIFRFFTGLFRPKQVSTGTDFAGVVEAVGKSVTTFRPGDRVFGFNDVGCGSHAACLVFPANGGIAKLPDAVSFEAGAAATEGAHYAYNYIRKTGMKKGDEVMVYGATGAIGSAAVQLLVEMGVHVTAVGNTKNKDLIQSLGPANLIDYETEDFTAGEKRYHFILDAVGKSSFGVCKKLLRPGGKYMSSELGPGNENLYLPLFTRWRKKRMVFPLPTDIKATLHYIAPLLASGHYKPVIDRYYKLDQIRDAFDYVNSGQKTGNVLLKISS